MLGYFEVVSLIHRHCHKHATVHLKMNKDGRSWVFIDIDDTTVVNWSRTLLDLDKLRDVRDHFQNFMNKKTNLNGHGGEFYLQIEEPY